jgi:hypothetical protein
MAQLLRPTGPNAISSRPSPDSAGRWIALIGGLLLAHRPDPAVRAMDSPRRAHPPPPMIHTGTFTLRTGRSGPVSNDRGAHRMQLRRAAIAAQVLGHNLRQRHVNTLVLPVPDRATGPAVTAVHAGRSGSPVRAGRSGSPGRPGLSSRPSSARRTRRLRGHRNRRTRGGCRGLQQRVRDRHRARQLVADIAEDGRIGP